MLDGRTVTRMQTNDGTLRQSAWRFEWLTPARCRIILVAWLLACAIANVVYLNRNCPIDLSGDERNTGIGRAGST